MFIDRRSTWRTASAACTLVALSAFILIQQSGLRGQSSAAKLTTVLADLAAAVPQDGTPTAAVSGVSQPLVATALPASIRDAMQSRRLRMNERNEIQVYVLMTSVTDTALAQLTAAGATIEITDAAARRVQAQVPASRLQLVAALPFVNFVRLPTYGTHKTGSVDTEGDAILNADVARQQFGLDGTGVKVGVISDGLKGVFATSCSSCGGVNGGPISTGDLPAATGTRNLVGVLTASTGGITGHSFASNGDLEGKPPSSPPCSFAGAGAEGTALLEIVHDLAPAAQLSFDNADTDLAFNQAVNALAATNDIVMDDFGFFGEATDGTSDVSVNTAAALNNPANRIRTYITSAGNSADEHYIGNYVDSGVDGATVSGVGSSGHLHLFQRSAQTTDVLGLGDQPYNLISLPTNGEVVIFLTWNDPFGGSPNNYDLYLVRQTTNTVVARSTDTQNGSQDPVEAIDFTNTGATDFFRIVVQNVRNQAAPRQLNLYSFEPECASDGPRLLATGHHERHNFNTASESVTAQSDAGGSPVSVISVGAICSGSPAASAVFAGSGTPDESCDDRTHSTIEFFSSRGPTTDGRMKPDISAIDGVSVTGAGSFENPFFGTSATGPHVAGEAALLLQAAPCLVSGAPGALDPATARGSLRNLILSGASPLSNVLPDPVFGAGLANAFASIQKTLPVFQGAATLVVPGNSPAGATMTAAQLGFSDPDSCGIAELKWTGGCGQSPASSLTCPLGTAALNVSATNNGLAFSSPAPVQVTVTTFGVGASPASATVAAGQSATYPLTISAVGGAFQNQVSLSCANVPAGSSCSFSPSTVVPGAASVQSVLTITTSARAGAAPVWRQVSPVIPGVALSFLFLTSVWWVLRDGRVLSGRRVVVFVAAGVVLGVVAAGVACSGGSKAPTPSPQTPAGSSAVGFSPTTLTFPGETLHATSAPEAFTLTNTGTAVLSIGAITATGDFAQTNNCGSSVAAGASCLVGVTFTPTAAGSRTGAVSVADNASGSPQTVQLSGTGVSAVGGTPAGSYPIMVAGASGTLVESSTVTLVVQ